MDEVHQPVCEISRKIRTVIGGPVLFQPPGDVNPREPFRRELDIRVGLVVPQEDIEARLVALDQVVFERQGFLLVVDENVIDRPGFTDQGAGFDIGKPVLVEVAADPAAEAFRLADVENRPVFVLVKVNPRAERKLRRLVAEFHQTAILLL